MLAFDLIHHKARVAHLIDPISATSFGRFVKKDFTLINMFKIMF